MEKPTVLVVDDDPDLLALIGVRLEAGGYHVASASSGEEALERFRAEHPRAVVTDLRMEGMDGHALFERLHAEAPSLPVIILTAHGSIPEAVQATQRGVFGFLTKPFDGRELLARVDAAVALSPPLAGDEKHADWPSAMVFASAAMAELQRQARRAAEGDEPLLLMGPRGAGKDTLARAIHGTSARSDKPFVALRCDGASEAQSCEARIAEALAGARGGVLYLDDVDRLPFADQARLLPLVQAQGLFAPVATAKGDADVRIVAGTCQPLEAAVRVGRFRADLYYALNRTVLTLPSLAQRREDIPLLVAHFVGQAGEAPGGPRQFSPEAMALLLDADWPGNVRELRSVVEQALAATVTPLVPATLVKRLLREEDEREMAPFDEARRAFEYDYLVQLLEATGGNVARAARVAQRNRTEFYKLLARHGLDPGAFKRPEK